MRRPGQISLVYLLLFVAAVGVFFLIRFFGEHSAHGPVAPVAASQEHETSHSALPRVLIALVTIMVTARILGVAFQWIGQPRVIGEVVAGIVLGPSLLGRISPDSMEFLLPVTVMPTLGSFAQLGVILYMFLVGLELNSGLLRSRAHATVAISHASIVAPFLLGALLALGAYSRYAPEGVTFTSFALFMGIAMAITAFPVLARILTDLGIERTELGVVALSCAAADDVTAWCLLAFVVGVTQAEVTGAMTTLLLAVGYIALMFGLVRPRIAGWVGSAGGKRHSTELTAWVLIAVLCSALATEAIGIHAIFGAFLLGAIIPHDSDLAQIFRHKLEDVVSILLLPTFFAVTGARVQINLLSEPTDWLFCGIIILIATTGKFGGAMAAARFTGFDWRTSAALGVLMNTRGLMELIVLNVGLDLGVISAPLFAMMVVMALVTTIATTPILRMLVPSPVGRPDDSAQMPQKDASSVPRETGKAG
jgi:Kef-type K+ transport system membrane component KefB